MEESFNNKDYADYLIELEKSIAKTDEYEAKRAEKRRALSAAQKRRKEQILRRRKFILLLTTVFLIFTLSIVGIAVLISDSSSKVGDNTPTNADIGEVNKAPKKPAYPSVTKKTLTVSENFDSQHIIVMNVEDHSIMAMRQPFERAYPASTTKIMTLLTAVDYITDYDDTFTMTYEITDPLYVAEATVAGFASGEVINLKDMLYGIILPSGGDASIGIATKISGSEQEFVKLMNKKAKSLGLKGTNFTNCTGLFDENHYTTAADMAVILSEAIKDPLCREILQTTKYTTKPTEQHPEGLEFHSTLFNYMYGDEPDGAEILGGKTGFVNESGYCIASFGKKDGGKEYITVNFEASSKWPAFYNQIDLYTAYVGGKSVSNNR